MIRNLMQEIILKRCVVLLAVLCLLGHLTGNAKAAEKSKGGTVSVDVNKLEQDKLNAVKDMNEGVQTGIFKKYRYCVHCSDGKKLNCTAPVGGEVGKKMCEGYGGVACGSGHVAYGECP